MLPLLALLGACSDGVDAPKASGATQDRSKTISRGTAYEATDYLVPGKIVLLDFYADW